MKALKNIVLLFGAIYALFALNKCSEEREAKRFLLNKGKFVAPTKSPFSHNLGINYSVEFTDWFNSDSIKYNAALKNKYSYERLSVISKDFKSIRIYSYFIAGWEQTGNISPEAFALINVAKNDNKVEAVLGTSCNKSWYLDSNNVYVMVDSMKTQFGSAINQVKTILIGNEINANSYQPSDIRTIMSNYKKAFKKLGLNIPVTVSFSNLPNQKGDNYSDSLVAAVVSSWDSNWNDNKPFVFIDPYPDAEGINDAAGVYNWQYGVTKYYNTIYPSLQIFIGETGAEGSDSDFATVGILNSIFWQLNFQYDSVKTNVPTFIFEAVNEPQKSGSPNQKYMGVYFDSNYPSVINVKLKPKINLPSWINK